MSGRLEILFPLFAEMTSLAGVGPKTAASFKSLGVETPKDLLMLLPVSGVDRRLLSSIRDVSLPGVATVIVEVGVHHPPRQRSRPYRVAVRDAKQEFSLVFFHARGEYLQNLLPFGQKRLVSGKIELFDGLYQMVHPDHVLAPDATETLPAFEPVYPLSAGVTKKGIAKAMQDALSRVPELPEWIDAGWKKQSAWPGWADAIRAAHSPSALAELSPSSSVRQRLAYDEMFAHQLTLALARAERRARPGRASHGDRALMQRMLNTLSYAPTNAQSRATDEILCDMASPRRMNRLLQGDVGSGKTLVALCALLTAVEAGGQGVLMAPTEILARQHFESLHPLAETAGVVVELLTGRDKGKERAAKQKSIAEGQAQIVIGTHAVFQRDVEFHDLRLAVVDEQHRFGVAQRLALGEKGELADILVMTATPIPRSLALAQFGDMDVSILDEKPPGRLPVQTSLASSERLDEIVDHLRNAMEAGRQIYWVCPLVEESENVALTAAQTRFEHLRAEFGNKVGLVHGQMPPFEKDAAMASFVNGETRVLVATTVIEVGVNVPNATIMVIERAENYGLAQLHQLRGRVGRGQGASTCLLLYDPPLSENASRRLKLMRETEDGFRISEEDLAMRGAGDVIGTAQSGLPRFRIADIERQAALMEVAQSDARKLLADDPKLTSPRGKAARTLLWLMEQEKAIRLIHIG